MSDEKYFAWVRKTYLKSSEGDFESGLAVVNYRLKQDRKQPPPHPISTVDALAYLEGQGSTGLDYAALGAISGSPEVFERGLELFPEAHELLLASLLSDGRFAEDRQAIIDLQRLAPDNAWPEMLLARNALNNGYFREAAEALARAAGEPFVYYDQEFRYAANTFLASGVRSRTG